VPFGLFSYRALEREPALPERHRDAIDHDRQPFGLDLDFDAVAVEIGIDVSNRPFAFERLEVPRPGAAAVVVAGRARSVAGAGTA